MTNETGSNPLHTSAVFSDVVSSDKKTLVTFFSSEEEISHLQEL